MRTKAILVVSFLLAFIATAQAGQYKVLWVSDGDTIQVERQGIVTQGIETEVRLMGIDAPETSKKTGERDQPYGQVAKKHLTSLIYGKMVDIKVHGFDRYNRLLGVVYLEGRNINLEMVESGLAEVYGGKTRRDFEVMPYLQAEREAKTIQRGIWSPGNIYISPRAWRRGIRLHFRKR